MRNYLLFLFFTILYLGIHNRVEAQSLQNIKASYAPLAPWVPSGILYDRNPLKLFLSSSWYNSINYDGTADSTCTVQAFKALHETKFHECFTEASILKFNPVDFNKVVGIALHGTDVSGWAAQDFSNHTQVHNAVLGFMDLDFHAITIDALDSAWIGKDANGLYELRVNPYQITDTLFLDTVNFSTHPDSIIPLTATYYPDSARVVQNAFAKYRLLALGVLTNEVYAEGDDPVVSFHLGDSLLISNKSNISYQIDWDNGNGFVPFNPNQRVFTIQYDSYGSKTIRIRTANQEPSDTHPFLYSNSTFMLGRLRSTDNQIAFPFTVNGDFCARDTSEFGSGQGNITIRLAPGRIGIVKPMVFVEGFDQLRTQTPETDSIVSVGSSKVGWGGLNWFSLSSGSIAQSYPTLSFYPNLLDSLENEGYDVIYVDFQTNRARIEKNANMLINVLDYVNNELKKSESNEGIAVLGASMGGLIARYAIRQMELAGCCHNVSIYGTFSTPHRGANIPLGLQKMLNYLGNDIGDFSNTEAKRTYANVLNSPVARQILVYHIDPTASQERTAFQNELDRIGQPRHTRKIVITDGSQQGAPQMNAQGITLLDNQRLSYIDLKIWRPEEFRIRDLTNQPEQFKTLKDIQSGVQPPSAAPAGDWSMLKLNAFAIGDNPTGNTQTVMETFGDVVQNFNRYLEMGDYYQAQAEKVDRAWKLWQIAVDVNHPSFPLNTLVTGSLAILSTSYALSRTTYIKIKTDAGLALRHAYNESENALRIPISVSYPTLPYDNCAGDYSNTQKAIADISTGLAKDDFPHHNFVATVSALDIDTNYLALDVYQNSDYLMESKIPFEAYWADGVGQLDPNSKNRPHVFIQAVNVSWINQKQREAVPVFLSQSSSSKLDTYFNFALKEDQSQNDPAIASDKILKAVEIKNQGTLHVNKYDEIGYLNMGIGIPEEFGSFDIITEQDACIPPVVTIQDGGSFIVGDDNYIPVVNGLQDNNKAKVFFAKGSKLVIESGGALRINDNSALSLEEGSELVIHPGASIHLDGANAVLEIRGKINLQDDAVLTATGNGYVRFAQPNQQPNLSDYWAVGSKAKMIFLGSGKHDKRMEVLNRLSIPAMVSQVSIEHCKVEIGIGHKLQIHAPAMIDNALFTKVTHPTGRYGEVAVYGQNGLTIKNSEFRNGNIGLLGVLSGANGMSVQNCDFKQCSNGLSIIDKNVQVINCRADSNDVGLNIANASAACDIRNSQFNRNSFSGISYSGTSTAFLNVYESTVRFNEVGIYATNNTNVRLTCNQITSNVYGVFLLDAGLDISNEARNNFASNSESAIYFERTTRLAMRNGFNNFGESQYYLYGHYGTFGSATDLCATGLDILNNRMPQVGGQGLGQVFLRSASGTPCSVINWQPMMPLAQTACPAVASLSYETTLIQQTPTSIVVNTPHYNGLLTGAISSALGDITDNFVNEVRADDEAVLKLTEIFAAVRTNYIYASGTFAESNDLLVLTQAEARLMLMAFDAAVRALGNAYRFGLLTPNGAQEQGEMTTHLSRLVQEMDYLFNFYSSSSDKTTWFKYQLSKAQLFRAGEHYDYAQNALNAIETEDEAFVGIKDFWSCVFAAEAQYVSGSIGDEEFRTQMEQCMANAIQLRRGRLTGEGIDFSSLAQSLTPQVVLYPNPANDQFSLWFSDNVNGYQVEILRMDGRMQATYIVPAKLEVFEINIHDLSAGLYAVRVGNGSMKPEVKKLVVSK